MKNLEQTLDSREVAKMIGKEHKAVMRDIRRYIKQINECNITPVTEYSIESNDFFEESTYCDAKGEVRPCYKITHKGCEFIANKLTGTKGTEFTARYISRDGRCDRRRANPNPNPNGVSCKSTPGSKTYVR